VRRDDVYFLDVADVIAAHAEGILLSPGEGSAIRVLGLLESATLTVEQGYYATLCELAEAYLYQISQAQSFENGNKRAAVIATAGFLSANGYGIRLDTRTWCRLLDGVASRTLPRSAIGRALLAAIGGKDEPVTEHD